MVGMQNIWTEPNTLAAIGGTTVGIIGLLLSFVTIRWSRRESRLEALTTVLQPMIKAAQQLSAANRCRQTCEKLKRSFASVPNSKEANERVNALIVDYGKLLSAGLDAFRMAEAEIASRSFRFPDRISKLVMQAQSSLLKLGKCVNDGKFDVADLQLAQFQDHYSRITMEARGWRLAGPFENLTRRLRKRQKLAPAHSKYELSENEMNIIMDLVHKRATSQSGNGFAVHPPQKLIDRPEIAKAENVIDELENEVFEVVFQDGTARMLSLPELMVFTFNLIEIAAQAFEVERMMQAIPKTEATVKVTFTMSVDEIMRPELVRTLLDKITFSEESSDSE